MGALFVKCVIKVKGGVGTQIKSPERKASPLRLRLRLVYGLQKAPVRIYLGLYNTDIRRCSKRDFLAKKAL